MSTGKKVKSHRNVHLSCWFIKNWLKIEAKELAQGRLKNPEGPGKIKGGAPKLLQHSILLSDATTYCQENFSEVLNLYCGDFLKETLKTNEIGIIQRVNGVPGLKSHQILC